MAVSPADAAQALRDIDVSASRSREFKGYRLAAPFFFIWGVIWIVGYGATGLDAHYGMIWPFLAVIGVAAGMVVAGRMRGRLGASGRYYGLRFGISSLVFFPFMMATFAILPPHAANQAGAFSALLVGMIYVQAGIWLYRRYLWLGLAIMTATVLGYFYLAPWFSFWMAAVGGGGLILTGFWMRKA